MAISNDNALRRIITKSADRFEEQYDHVTGQWHRASAAADYPGPVLPARYAYEPTGPRHMQSTREFIAELQGLILRSPTDFDTGTRRLGVFLTPRGAFTLTATQTRLPATDTPPAPADSWRWVD